MPPATPKMAYGFVKLQKVRPFQLEPSCTTDHETKTIYYRAVFLSEWHMLTCLLCCVCVCVRVCVCVCVCVVRVCVCVIPCVRGAI